MVDSKIVQLSIILSSDDEFDLAIGGEPVMRDCYRSRPCSRDKIVKKVLTEPRDLICR
jgi:hypothetical protein